MLSENEWKTQEFTRIISSAQKAPLTKSQFLRICTLMREVIGYSEYMNVYHECCEMKIPLSAEVHAWAVHRLVAEGWKRPLTIEEVAAIVRLEYPETSALAMYDRLRASHILLDENVHYLMSTGKFEQEKCFKFYQL